MIYTLGERRADIAPGCYVAPSAQLIGSVRLAPGASVWFNVVIRGDTDWIEVGEGSNVQDGTVIHTDPGVPVRIGADVTIGHKAFLHGCSVGDGSMIANGAMVLDGARIGQRCLVAAGALVPPGKQIPDGTVVMGAPCRAVREVTERDLAMLARAAAAYRARLDLYAGQLSPDPRFGPPGGAAPG
ncbi:MAG: gamma carbonic anhydrase family protein [Steroidobacteraceae bacterium]|jgi:carbonic anhydrase/acetyltransferase-like protein (isoleucine patch superfamily)|nr:gamma carbonic anhydrase family protein [Steroidobacteraceae bacterium]